MITVVETIVPQRCGECGLLFGMEKEYRDRKIQEHGGFFCPNGHSREFIRETEAERLRKQLAQTEQCLSFARADTQRARERANHTENRLRSTKGVVTRMKRKIVAGRCVCCSRQFKDLESHMKDRHPKWDPDKAADALTAKSST
jgi:DNA-directed RNA polymerase subunit RPC12/RpoP